MTLNELKKEAEERFDEKFSELFTEHATNAGMIGSWENDNIKSFISTLLSSYKEELIKKIEDVKKECDCDSCKSDCLGCGEPRSYCGGHGKCCDDKECKRNFALDSVIVLIKK